MVIPNCKLLSAIRKIPCCNVSNLISILEKKNRKFALHDLNQTKLPIEKQNFNDTPGYFDNLR